MALVVLATVASSAAVTAAAVCKIKEYYASHKNKDKSKSVDLSYFSILLILKLKHMRSKIE